MRVMIVEPAGNLWGSERALLDGLRHLDDKDIEIAVCCPPHRPLLARLDHRIVKVYASFTYELHEKSKAHRVWTALRLAWNSLRFRPDLIYLNQAGAYRVALLAARLLSVKIVAHVRLYEDVKYIARQGPEPRWLAAVICISADISAAFEEHGRLQKIKQYQVYDPYESAPRGPRLPRSAHFRIACVSRLAPSKGQEILLSALAILQGDIEYECIIAGTGDESFSRALRHESKKQSLSIEWRGFVENIPELLESCDVLVLPSFREPLGRVIFEAWDAGAVPIVYTESGGSAEIVQLANGGIAYPDQSGESLAMAIRRAMCMTQSEREELIRNGREWMARHCNPERYSEALREIFMSVARSESEFIE